MNTYRSEYHYLEGFVKACMDQGLTAEQTSHLLDEHVRNEVVRQSPEYQEGVKQAVASAKNPSLLPDIPGFMTNFPRIPVGTGQLTKDFAVGAGLSTLGTTAGLGLLGLLAKYTRMPMLSKLFGNAAKESIMFLNPSRSWKLLKRLPEAARLTAKQMELSNAGLLNPNRMGANELVDAATLQKQVKNFHKAYGEMPADTLEKGVGVANGVMNLGIGGAVALAPRAQQKE